MKYRSITLRLQPYGSYDCISFSDEKIGKLGFFLSEIGCRPTNFTFFKNWIINDDYDDISGNMMDLEKEDNHIYISNHYDERKNLVKFKISYNNLIALLYHWQEKVCNLKPQEVTITHENDTFILTTSD